MQSFISSNVAIVIKIWPLPPPSPVEREPESQRRLINKEELIQVPQAPLVKELKEYMEYKECKTNV